MADFDLTSDITSGELDSGVVHVQSDTSQNTVTPAGTVNANAQPSREAPAAAADEGAVKEPTLREKLSSAFKGEDNNPAAQADAQANTGQQRGPDGKFLPKDGQVATGADAQAQQQPTGLAQPPRGMSHEDFQKFNSLPAEMQQFVARTMEGLEQQAAKFEGLGAVEQIIAPRRQAWAVNGMTEQSALTQLFALSDFATQSPVDFVRWFAGNQGIDLGVLAQGGGQQQQVDPVIAQMQQQLQNLQGHIGQQTHAQQQQAHNDTVNAIVAFAEEKGADGKPLRPYFEELGTAVKPYIAAVKDQFPQWNHTQVLHEAYERACWATPAIRTRLQEAEAAKRLADQAGQGVRARAAAVSVNGAPASGQGQSASTGQGTIRDTLREQFAAARA